MIASRLDRKLVHHLAGMAFAHVYSGQLIMTRQPDYFDKLRS